MTKAKKTLYLLAGLFKVVVSGLGLLFLLLSLALKGTIIKLMEEGDLRTMIENIAKEDDSYSYLLGQTAFEQREFLSSILNKVLLLFLIIAVIWLIIGILNLIISKKLGHGSKCTILAIVVTVIGWMLIFPVVSNMLTTVAVCLRSKTKNNTSSNVIKENAR